jgi:hypothetical protein
MTLCRKFGLLALISLAAPAWIQLDRDSNVHTLSTAVAPEIECSMRDPLSRCAGNLNVGYPLGDGLVFTPIEDFF